MYYKCHQQDSFLGPVTIHVIWTSQKCRWQVLSQNVQKTLFCLLPYDTLGLKAGLHCRDLQWNSHASCDGVPGQELFKTADTAGERRIVSHHIHPSIQYVSIGEGSQRALPSTPLTPVHGRLLHGTLYYKFFKAKHVFLERDWFKFRNMLQSSNFMNKFLHIWGAKKCLYLSILEREFCPGFGLSSDYQINPCYCWSFRNNKFIDNIKINHISEIKT